MSLPSCIGCKGTGSLSYELYLNIQPEIDRLGIDIGGVIISDDQPIMIEDGYAGKDENEDVESLKEELPDEDVEYVLRRTEERGAFSALRRLVRLFGSQNVFLISKAQPGPHRVRTLRWLERRRFFERVGLSEQHVFFCTERWEKMRICEELRVSYFIDDRLDVLENVSHASSIKSCLLFGPRTDPAGEYAHDPFFYSPSVVKAPDWEFIIRFFGVASPSSPFALSPQQKRRLQLNIHNDGHHDPLLTI